MSTSSLIYTLLAHAALFVLVVIILRFAFQVESMIFTHKRRSALVFIAAFCATYLFWFLT